MTVHANLNALEGAGLIGLAQVTPEVEYWFRHALVQEAAYDSLLKADRRRLHLAVAGVLERLHPDGLDDIAATLAHHFEKGGDPEQAIPYLRRAGDRARRRFANQEAIGFYGAALRLSISRPRGEASGAAAREAASLREALGEVLALTGRHAEAGARLAEAEAGLPQSETVWRARLRRKMGGAWEALHEVGRAMQEFALAEEALGPEPASQTSDWGREWALIQMARMGAHYWLNQWREMEELAERIRPVLDRHGTPALRAQYLDCCVDFSARRDLYRISAEVMIRMREMLLAAEESGDPLEIVNARFSLGFGHLWRRELKEAESQLQAALDLAERIGSVRHRVWSLAYLGTVARFRGRLADARHYAHRCVEAARAGDDKPLLLWVGVAFGNLAWAAGREGDLAEAARQGRQAADSWANLKLEFPFWWIAAWPLASAALAQGRVDVAVAQARRMLQPSQQKPPPGLEAALREAVEAWDRREPAAARTALAGAVESATAWGYV